MALTAKSLILYDFEVTQFNCNVFFKNSGAGSLLQAVLDFGYYSLDGLMTALVRKMNEVDTTSAVYSYSIDRTISGGTQNRVTITTSGAYLDLDFAQPSTVATLIGFPQSYLTGATSYQGTSTAGTALIPEYVGYNYLGPEFDRKVQGNVNISASGEKEAVIFAIQKFISVEFKYEPQAKVITEWMPFFEWAIQQRAFEFTPSIAVPTTVYQVTLDKTSADGKGLAYRMVEMLPDFPFNFRTGAITMRQKQSTQFIV